MPDLNRRLTQALTDVDPRWSSPDDVARESARRHRRRRVGAGLVAGAIGVVAILATVLALREIGSSTLEPVGPVDVSTLRQAWSVEVAGALFDRQDHTLPVDERFAYALDESGIVAFPKDCLDPCPPAWRGDVAYRSPLLVEIALGRDVVFVTNRSTLLAFDPACADDGSTCEPMWRADPDEGTGFLGPVASGRLVRVFHSLGGSENAEDVEGLVFDADACGTEEICQPIVTTALGTGPVHVPGVALDGVFYQQVGDILSGIDPASCAAAAPPCPDPSFSVRARGDEATEAGFLSGPVLSGDQLVVSSGDGNLYAYDRACGLDCRPLWVGRVSDFLSSPPVVAGDLVVVASSEGLTAFPATCGGRERCPSTWRTRESGEIVHADRNVVIVVDRGDGEDTIHAYPVACDDPCEPVWNGRTGAQIQGVDSDGGSLFVGLKGGALQAYPIDCTGRCGSVWEGSVPGRDAWIMHADETGVYVVSSRGSPQPLSGDALMGFRGSE